MMREVQQVSYRKIRGIVSILGLLAAVASPLAAASRTGKISGIVLDDSGVPQMGATVLISPDSLSPAAPIRLLTNAQGRFASALMPGSYMVRVTLAGFLPAFRSEVLVSSHQTTSMQISMGSIFSGLANLRQRPNQAPENGEWSWVLRSASATRPILRWRKASSSSYSNPFPEIALDNRETHSRVDVTSGVRPGSATSFSNSPATAVAYQERVGTAGQLLLAGQVSYESQTTNGSFAAIWLPSGNRRDGPSTTVVVRQSRLGLGGPTVRAMQLDQQGALALTDDVTLRYGAQYILTGLGAATTTGIRPRAELAMRIAPGWQASALLASRPWPEASPEATAPLQSAMDSLDALPTVLFRDGRPILESGWHEELAVERLLQNHGRLILAGFHDGARDLAIFGAGDSVSNNPDYLQDFFSNGFAYDSGSSNSFGARAVYQQQLHNGLMATVVYAYAGALAPLTQMAPSESLRDVLATRYRHSVAGSVSTKIPYTKTQLTTGYKWISGTVVSRQDEFGEAFYGVDPFFNLVVRQPLPCLRHMEAVADFGNLLAQGYVPMTTADGQVVLVSAYRTFRGGISVQF